MRLLLVPHGETEWNAQGRFQGHSDVPLNARGQQQAALLQRRLAAERLDVIVASDLRRASETAQILAAPHGLIVQSEPRLRELHFGDWEGLTYAEIQQQDPAGLAAWHENPLQAAPPGGERLSELAQRLQDFLSDLSRDQVILLVAHRGSLRVLLCLLLGLPVTRHWDFRLDLASVTEVELADSKANVRRLNETLDHRV